MRNNILLIIAAFSIVSCKKYEDGPNFSIRSEEARLTNKWEMVTAYETAYTNSPQNGEDLTGVMKNFTVEFNKDKSYTIEYFSSNLVVRTVENGSWNFSDDKLTVTTTGIRQKIDEITGEVLFQENENITWRIMRLKKKELWVWYQAQIEQPWIYFTFVPS